MSKASKEAQNAYKCIFPHNFLKNSFGKLSLRTFQPYQILCMLKHVKDVEDYIMQHYIYMESTHYIVAHVEDVEGVKYYE